MHVKSKEEAEELILRCISESHDYPNKRELIQFLSFYDYEEAEIIGSIYDLLRENKIFKTAEDTYMTLDFNYDSRSM